MSTDQKEETMFLRFLIAVSMFVFVHQAKADCLAHDVYELITDQRVAVYARSPNQAVIYLPPDEAVEVERRVTISFIPKKKGGDLWSDLFIITVQHEKWYRDYTVADSELNCSVDSGDSGWYGGDFYDSGQMSDHSSLEGPRNRPKWQRKYNKILSEARDYLMSHRG